MAKTVTDSRWAGIARAVSGIVGCHGRLVRPCFSPLLGKPSVPPAGWFLKPIQVVPTPIATLTVYLTKTENQVSPALTHPQFGAASVRAGATAAKAEAADKVIRSSITRPMVKTLHCLGSLDANARLF
jgi:hypothetical protein